MIDDFLAGTRALHPVPSTPALTVIVDDDAWGQALADAAREVTTPPVPAAEASGAAVAPPMGIAAAIEVRASLTGPTRASVDWVPDVVFVLGQLGLGAAGNGVWVALTEIWRRATGRRGEPAPSTRLTVVIPSEHGETRVESVIVGSADAEATVRAVQQIVQSLVGDGGDTGDTGDSGPAG